MFCPGNGRSRRYFRSSTWLLARKLFTCLSQCPAELKVAVASIEAVAQRLEDTTARHKTTQQLLKVAAQLVWKHASTSSTPSLSSTPMSVIESEENSNESTSESGKVSGFAAPRSTLLVPSIPSVAQSPSSSTSGPEATGRKRLKKRPKGRVQVCFSLGELGCSSNLCPV